MTHAARGSPPGIPAQAVATIGPGDRIELKSITLGRNLGTEVEVVKGLSPSDRVVNSPPDSLAAGDLVRIAGQQSNASNSGIEDVAAAPESKGLRLTKA